VARRAIILLEDDTDGGDPDEMIFSAVDVLTYEIDLNDGNAGQDARRCGDFAGAVHDMGPQYGGGFIALPARARGPGRS